MIQVNLRGTSVTSLCVNWNKYIIFMPKDPAPGKGFYSNIPISPSRSSVKNKEAVEAEGSLNSVGHQRQSRVDNCHHTHPCCVPGFYHAIYGASLSCALRCSLYAVNELRCCFFL